MKPRSKYDRRRATITGARAPHGRRRHWRLATWTIEL